MKSWRDKETLERLKNWALFNCELYDAFPYIVLAVVAVGLIIWGTVAWVA